MNSKLVSIIIPTYNGARYIAQTVKSALDQTYKDTEILVINDGGTDHTDEVMKPFEGRVRYIKKPNGGPASARNEGIKAAKGNFLAFLDGDDLWDSKKLEEQMEKLNEDDDIGLVYTRIYTFYDNGPPQMPTKNKDATARIMFDELFWQNSIPNSTVLIKKQCMDELGLFDEDPELISVEDYDVWLRISSRYKCALIDQPLVGYRLHEQNISKNISRSYYGEAKVIRKNYERFKDQFPHLGRMINKRMAKVWYQCAYDYYYVGRYQEARKEFAHTIQTLPFHPKAWFYLLATCLPAFMINALRK